MEAPAETPAVEYPAEARDGRGRWTKDGPSPCPGGRGLAGQRFSRYVREVTGNGQLLADRLVAIVQGSVQVEEIHVVRQPGKEAGEKLETVRRPPNVREVTDAARALKEWGLGKAVASSQMVDPAELGEAPAVSTEPAALLLEARETLAALLGLLRRLVQAGEAPSTELIQAVREATVTFQQLEKERRAQEAAQGVEGLAAEQLVEQLMGQLPPALLGQALALLPQAKLAEILVNARDSRAKSKGAARAGE